MVPKSLAGPHFPVRINFQRATIDGRAKMAAEINQRAEDTDLALDMIGRAYLALAILFESAHPGEFKEAQKKIRSFVEDNLIIIKDTTGVGHETTLEDAAARVRKLLATVESEIEALAWPTQKAVG